MLFADLPEVDRAGGGRRYARSGPHVYRHFQHATAQTVFVIGEFPWKVRVDEAVVVDDFTDPPYVLSAETTAEEVTWSEGKYRGWKVGMVCLQTARIAAAGAGRFTSISRRLMPERAGG